MLVAPSQSVERLVVESIEVHLRIALYERSPLQLNYFYFSILCNFFCNSFNARTKESEQGVPVPVVISVYQDKSFDFVIKTTPASILIKKAAGVPKGSGTPNSLKVGTVTRAQLEEIAKKKDPDLTAADMDAAVRTLEGSARSAGITVEG